MHLCQGSFKQGYIRSLYTRNLKKIWIKLKNDLFSQIYYINYCPLKNDSKFPFCYIYFVDDFYYDIPNKTWLNDYLSNQINRFTEPGYFCCYNNLLNNYLNTMYTVSD